MPQLGWLIVVAVAHEDRVISLYILCLFFVDSGVKLNGECTLSKESTVQLMKSQHLAQSARTCQSFDCYPDANRMICSHFVGFPYLSKVSTVHRERVMAEAASKV